MWVGGISVSVRDVQIHSTHDVIKFTIFHDFFSPKWDLRQIINGKKKCPYHYSDEEKKNTAIFLFSYNKLKNPFSLEREGG